MVYHFKNSKRIAFTLAEVLITLGVIGVVAALTLPSVVQKHKEKVYINQLKVVYSELDNAVNYAIAEHGPINTWGNKQNNNDYFDLYVMPHLKVAKVCESSGNPNVYEYCWGKVYSKGNGETANDFGRLKKSYILANGASIMFTSTNGDNIDHRWCKASKSEQDATIRYLSNCGTVQVDINGKKGPNQFGVDFQQFNIFTDGIDLLGKQADRICGTSFTNGCLENAYCGGGVSCSAWMVLNGNMDYLHCNDLSWNGKTKCK